MNFPIRLGCLMIVGALLIGCDDDHDESSGHGHSHEHGHGHSDAIHLSFGEVVEKIGTYRDAIQSAFANEKRDEAHDPLHDIGFLIERLTTSAAEMDMPEEDWAEVKQAAERLSTAFGRVDALFHDDSSGVPFSDVEQEVQAALEALQAKVKAASKSDKFKPQAER